MFPANSVYVLLEAAFFHPSQKSTQISIRGFVFSLVIVSFVVVCVVKLKSDIQLFFTFVQWSLLIHEPA